MADIGEEHLHILQHSLGADMYGLGGGYRNYFVADTVHSDMSLLLDLVAAGFMERKPAPLRDGSTLFCVTPSGKQHMQASSPKPPITTRAARRYQAYLRADACDSFGQWLRKGHWKTA